jgi:hypothetical protein
VVVVAKGRREENRRRPSLYKASEFQISQTQLLCNKLFLKADQRLSKIPKLCLPDEAADEVVEVEGVASEVVEVPLGQGACLPWVSHLQTYKLCQGKETRCTQCGALIL